MEERLKIEDLMCNDIVLTEAILEDEYSDETIELHPFRITDISPSGEVYNDDGDNCRFIGDWMDDCDADRLGDLMGMPLTEEILKANGFWFGLLPDEQDILSVGLGVPVHYEERWVFDNENSGTISIQFPEDGNGGQIVICNDDKYFCYVWAEDTTTVNVHDLQHFLRDCKLYDIANNFKIQ